MEAFNTIESTFVALSINDIDTDQIIPARFLKVIDKAGLGDNLFYDWRYDENGDPRQDFVLNTGKAKEAKILVAGDNFGCGSSREHAPWALMGYGFKAVISTSFADIFKNNSLKNGLLPVVVDAAVRNSLFEIFENNPGSTLKIDLADQLLHLSDGNTVTFPIDTFSKTCLLDGIDQLGYLQKHMSEIEAYEMTHPARVRTL